MALEKWRPFFGIGITAGSGLFFCLTNVLVKELSHVNAVLITCIRFWIITLLSSPIVMIRIDKESPFPSGKRRYLLARSLLGALAIITHFYALQVRLSYDVQKWVKSSFITRSDLFSCGFFRLYISKWRLTSKATNKW